MKRTDIPKKHPIPFANAGDKNPIPQSGGATGAATLTEGFPPETMVPVIAGGIPPDGKDMNGVLFELSDMGRWANAGAEYTFDPGFSAAIGGYPSGAKLLSSDGKSVFISEVDDNTANPEAVSDKWVGFSNYRGAITATTGVHTLTALEASRDLIVVSGTLTGNVQLVFPAWVKHWQIINSTTGNFSVTCKTATGSGVVVKGGFLTDIYGDGTSISSHANTDVAGVVRSVNTHEPDASGNVKLGTAADADVGKDLPGQVLTVGNYGLANALTALDSTDLNTLQTFGFYVVRNSVNGPVGSNPGTVFLKVITWQSGNGASGYRVIQEVIGYGASASTGNRVWRRTWTGTIWTGWVEFYSEAYKPTAVDTNALPLTGGTMTDEIKSTSANILRGIQGGYGAILRMDANGLYFLQTNKDDPNGNYNDKRSLTISNDTGAVGIGTQLTVTNADFINKVGYTTYTGGDGHNHAQVGGLRLEVDGSQLAELYYNVDTTSQSAEVSLHNKYGTTDSYLSLRNDGQLAIVGSWPAITMSTGTTWHPDGNIQGSCWEGDYLSNWLLTKVMPVGAALPWPQETPLPGWLLCNGSGFDRNACPRLAGVFPNGILPDYRGVFLRGKDNGKGIDPNRALGDFQASQAPASSAAGMGWHDYAGRDTGHISQMGSDNTYNYTVKQETEQQRETRPANVSVNYIVRAA